MKQAIAVLFAGMGLMMSVALSASAESNTKAEAIAEAKAKRSAAIAEKKAELEAAKESRQEKITEKKAEREAKKEEIQGKIDNRKEELTEKANERTDQRQENQAKRIQHGISKGYLTDDEISKLNSQQQGIESLQQQFNSDGKVSKDEAKQLREALNTASLNIFGEKHDADGKQMSVFRLGKNIKLNDEIAQKLGSENLSKTEAKAYLKDFHRTIELKKLLNGDLSDTDRTKYQDEYNSLLNKYFTVI